MQANKLTHIAGAGTTTVKGGSGYLENITVNTTAAGTITIYDSLTGSGTVIAILKASVAEGTYHFKGNFINGLTIVTGAASDITVSSE